MALTAEIDDVDAQPPGFEGVMPGAAGGCRGCWDVVDMQLKRDGDVEDVVVDEAGGGFRCGP
jgi:hypothetical protein